MGNLFTEQLMKICEKGDANYALSLIDKGADVNARDSNAFTPLMLACKYGFTDIARLLIDHGADVNVMDTVGSPLL